MLVFALAGLELSSSVAAQDRSIDLPTEAAITFVGMNDDHAGASVAGGGDLNGDGVPDALIGACAGSSLVGTVYALLGSRAQDDTLSPQDFGPHGDLGFRIDGGAVGDHACRAAFAGDVNGDGYDDIIIAAFEGTSMNRNLSGTAYLVFGKPDTTNVDLALFDAGVQGNLGFRIDGPHSRALLGYADGANDVNGDGLDDIVLGAPFAGASYLVFGKENTEPVDLADFETGTHGAAGFRIATPTPNRNHHYSVAGVGDVNGDGVPDLAVGVLPSLRARGSVYVVFGKATPDEIRVKRLSGDGYQVRGAEREDFVGLAVAGPGDINGDGRDELLIGAPGHGKYGTVFVLFGRRSHSNVDLGDFTRLGYRITGTLRAGAGMSVGASGDVNGDGRPDTLLGSPGANYNGRPVSGSSYVVFGKRGFRAITFRDLGSRGFRMDGATYDMAGNVAGLGDMNGDGLADVMVGAPYADVGEPGHAYIVWGRP